jgi:hypothetical protein
LKLADWSWPNAPLTLPHKSLFADARKPLPSFSSVPVRERHQAQVRLSGALRLRPPSGTGSRIYPYWIPVRHTIASEQTASRPRIGRTAACYSGKLPPDKYYSRTAKPACDILLAVTVAKWFAYRY